MEHRCQQHEVRGHTVMEVTGSVPDAANKPHAFVSDAPVLNIPESTAPSFANVHE